MKTAVEPLSSRATRAPQALALSRALAAVGSTLTQRVPGGHLQLALYALYTIVLFVICLAATFPHQLFVRRMLERAPTAPFAIEVGGVHLGWTLAYIFDTLSLNPIGSDSSLPLLTASNVRVAPALLGLVRGHPYPVAIRARLYDGTLAATLDLRPAALEVSAVLTDIDVARYRGLGLFMEGDLRGRLGVNVHLRGDLKKPSTTNGHIELRASGVALEGGSVRGITVPALHFSELGIAGELRNGRFELSKLTATGQEVNIDGQGTVLLQQPLTASLMNLTLTLRPAADVPPEMRLALGLIPGEVGADGVRTLRLAGSLAQPRVQ